MPRHLPALLIACAAALAGCGGGGGAAADSPLGPRALALDGRNAADAMTLALGAADRALLLTRLAADTVDAAVLAGDSAPRSVACPIDGTQTVVLTDRDGSSAPSAGDRIELTLRDCVVPLFGRRLDGTLSIELAALGAALRATVDTGAGLALGPIGSPGASATAPRLLGSLAVERSDDGLLIRWAAASTAADDFRTATPGAGGTLALEAARGLSASKQVAADAARNTVAARLVLDSDALGGVVQLSTAQALSSLLNTYPEQGRLALRGAGAAVATLLPHGSVSSEQFDVALDADGDGRPDATVSGRWAAVTAGHLWWDGSRALNAALPPYDTQAYSTTRFGYATVVPAMPSAATPVRLQFDGVVGDWSATPRFRFADQGGPPPADPRLQDVEADHRRDGALVRLWPTAPLRHGRTYAVLLSTDGGQTWLSSALVVRDTLGNTLELVSYFATASTPATMQAVIGADTTTLLGSGSLTLDSAGSRSARPIAGRLWRQLTGPPLLIAGPQAAETAVTAVHAPGLAIEPAVVELTLTDTSGEVETSRITLNLIRPPGAGQVLYLRSSAGDLIGAGQTLLLSDATGSFSGGGTPGANYVVVDGTSRWTVDLVAAGGAPLDVGAYGNVLRYPFNGTQNGMNVATTGRACDSVTGRFDVLEVARDPVTQAITTLAIDFEQHCNGAQAPPLYGSLRIGSAIPLRP